MSGTHVIDIDGLEEEARRKADANPGCGQVERTAVLVLDPEPGWYGRPCKFLQVVAVYGAHAEKMIGFGHADYVKYGFKVKGFAYELYDAKREEWEQVVGMTREAAVALLEGTDPPALPKPAARMGDVFEGLT